MKFIEKTESLEPCAESGWYAWDYQMDGPLTGEFILSLKPLGDFVYLSMLAKPFFKIEGDYFHIKGVQGTNFFRVAVHQEHPEFLEQVEQFLLEKERREV